MDEPNYRRFQVWQKAHANALSIISLLEKCNRKYSRILDQCIGAATSVGANIAEGNSSKSRKRNYFEIALNSSYEFDNWIQILKDSEHVCSDKKIVLIIEKNYKVLDLFLNFVRIIVGNTPR